MKRIVLLLLLVVGAFASEMACARRNAQQVQKERSETQRKINSTQKQIKVTLEQTQAELNKITSLRGQIREKDLSIKDLSKSRDSLQRHKKLLSDTLASINRKVAALKQSRAEALRAVRKHRKTTGSTTAFIFSSATFKQASKRSNYLLELANWQRTSELKLVDAIDALNSQQVKVDSANSHLRRNLDQINNERRVLEENNRQVKTVLASLKKQNKNLEKILKQQQQQARELDRELNRIIEEEAKRAAQEKDKGGDNKKAPDAVGKTFQTMKGKLPMPIDRRATVVAPFGVQEHAEHAKVKLQNNGVDFETSSGAHAIAVYPGTVSMVIKMPGYNNVVLIRHGEYLTVYAGLKDISVKKGQDVKTGDVLGEVCSDAGETNRVRLHFEVRHEKEKLNPELWLK